MSSRQGRDYNGNRPKTPNEVLRDTHKNMLTSELTPRQPGITCAKDPNAPLWKAQIVYEDSCKLTELIRAESAAAAKLYINNKYRRVSSVLIEGRANVL